MLKKKYDPRQAANKYKKDYARMAEEVCREGGYTDEKLAALFGVIRKTIHNWKKNHEDFREAVQRGKDAFDTEKVEAALLKSALGFTHKKQYYPPNVTAIIYWTTNRNRERWKHIKEIKHDVPVPLSMTIDLGGDA